MPRIAESLTPLAVQRLKKSGMFADGGGLYLRVTEAGGKYWMFRYTQHGKRREMGLGSFPDLSLADARVEAGDCRKIVAGGKDPIDNRKATLAQDTLSKAKDKTFRECADAYIDAHRAGWRNAKHVQQWENTLKTYAYPFFGDTSVQQIDVTLVTSALEQKNADYGKGQTFWTARPETASRLRGRIELILDWATARGYRTGENPARWRGHLANLLPKTSKIRRIKHQPALPYDRVGDFFCALKEQDMNTAALALQFTIITGCRTGECLGVVWNEIDWDDKAWNIPAVRTKTGRDHRAALSSTALNLLKKIKKEQETTPGKQTKSGYIFVGNRKKPLSDMAMLAVIRRMNAKGKKLIWVDPRQDNRPVVTHGFRSTFRDWAAEQTNVSRDVVETALSHVSGDKVELAYRRTDFFEKRRLLMETWAKYCGKPSPKKTNDKKVVAFKRA